MNRTLLVNALFGAVVFAAGDAAAAQPCSAQEEMACQGNATITLQPLSEIADYQGQEGGLYPGGGNERPEAHVCAGVEAAQTVVPLGPDGSTDPSGRIVMISIGMSNTTQEYSEFQNLFGASTDWPDRNPALLAVDGAQGGQDASSWVPGSPSADNVWSTALGRLTSPGFGGEAGVTPEQVQVVWMKQALAGPMNLNDNAYDCGAGPCGEFPGHAMALQQDMEAIIVEAQSRFPNLKIVYLSSRTSSYLLFPDDGAGLNPEPFAFESAFSVKWAVDAAMGAGGPYVTWGPYIWAHSGCRDDGFRWCCDHTSGDFTHPSDIGRGVVAAALMDYFSTDDTAVGWFLADPPAPADCMGAGDSSGGTGDDAGDTAGATGGPSSTGGADGAGSGPGDGADDGAGSAGTSAGADGAGGDSGDDSSGCGCTTSGGAPLWWLLILPLAIRRARPARP